MPNKLTMATILEQHTLFNAIINTFVVCFKNRFRKKTAIVFIFAVLLCFMRYLFIAAKLELDTI